jgi:hypothetical protein
MLPVRKPIRPSDLKGKVNGIVDLSVHVPVLMAGGVSSFMHHLAARGTAALVAKCKAETGLTLSTIGLFRLLSTQENGFFASYLDHYDPALCTLEHQRQYQGKTWYLRKGHIPKAVPGTSRHGDGLANDAAWLIGGRRVNVRTNQKGWAWLQANVIAFGFSWAFAQEGEDDPHIQWFPGDTVPKAVLDFEAANGVLPQVPSQPVENPTGKLPVPPPPTIARSNTPTPGAVDLQKHLAVLKLYRYAIDGLVGPRTVAGIIGLQEKLAGAGLYTGKIDGIYGPRTRAAYMAWPSRPT